MNDEYFHDFVTRFQRFKDTNDSSIFDRREHQLIQLLQKETPYVPIKENDMHEYYNKIGKMKIDVNKHKSIFNNEFLTSKYMKSFASKFYANKIAEASHMLTDSVIYQMTESVTRNRIMLYNIKDETFLEFLRLIRTKSDIPNSLLHSISIGNQPKISLFIDIVNDVVTSAFTTDSNDNYYDVLLKPQLATLINNFKENVNYFVPLGAKHRMTIFEWAAQLATSSGKKRSPFVLPDFKKNTNLTQSQCNSLLSESAQYNEILRRKIEQDYDE
nr:glycoprotein 41 [Neodiprion sertifer nucleopolyhedrovirus]